MTRANVTLLPNGIKAHIPNRGNATPPKRGACTGWNSATSRRNTRFLMSVDTAQLPLVGVAYSLTMRDCPATAADLARIVKIWIDRLRAKGVTLVHWVIEFQRRGVPHLHAAVFADAAGGVGAWEAAQSADHEWLDLTACYGSQPRSQHMAGMNQDDERQGGRIGWFLYLAKHAGRGAAHYQRSRASLPAGWQKVGRMWGKSGEWPTSEQGVEVSMATFHRFRRLVRSHQVAALSTVNLAPALLGRRLRYVRRMLRCHDAKLSPVRPISVWMPQRVQVALLEAALATSRHAYVLRPTDGAHRAVRGSLPGDTKDRRAEAP